MAGLQAGAQRPATPMCAARGLAASSKQPAAPGVHFEAVAAPALTADCLGQALLLSCPQSCQPLVVREGAVQAAHRGPGRTRDHMAFYYTRVDRQYRAVLLGADAPALVRAQERGPSSAPLARTCGLRVRRRGTVLVRPTLLTRTRCREAPAPASGCIPRPGPIGRYRRTAVVGCRPIHRERTRATQLLMAGDTILLKRR